MGGGTPRRNLTVVHRASLSGVAGTATHLSILFVPATTGQFAVRGELSAQDNLQHR